MKKKLLYGILKHFNSFDFNEENIHLNSVKWTTLCIVNLVFDCIFEKENLICICSILISVLDRNLKNYMKMYTMFKEQQQQKKQANK